MNKFQAIKLQLSSNKADYYSYYIDRSLTHSPFNAVYSILSSSWTNVININLIYVSMYSNVLISLYPCKQKRKYEL